MDSLKHLRYLDLSYTQIGNLPKSLTRLYHLQTLILGCCVNLKELPKGIGKLINLRHLYLPDDINLPREIGKLSSLQTLYPCNVGIKDREDTTAGSDGSGGEEGCGIEVLEGLNLLIGYLVINHLRNVRSGIEEAERANLMGKKNLDRIFLSWHKLESATRKDGEEYTSQDEAVLEALQPHPNLKMLDIDQYFGVKLPRWMGGGDPLCLPNLVFLQLSDCPKCEQLVGFGKLPSLKVLKLWKMDGIKCLGNEFYYNNSDSVVVVLFPSLKKLTLGGMCSLEEWVDIPRPIPTVANDSSCFPCLEVIWIVGCPNLRITPTHFPSLKELNLQEINEKVAVPLITANLLNSLESVELMEISELRFLPHRLLQGNNKVKVLKVVDCLDFQGFTSLPSEEEEEEGGGGGGGFNSLRVLSLVRLPALKFLPDIRSFTSLEKLYIYDCESLKPLPEDLTCLPSSLEHLKLVHIRNVQEVDDFEWQK